MSVEIEGLEFQIEATATEAAKAVDALAESFNKLKKTLRGNAVKNVSDKLEAISAAAEKLTGIDKLEKLANALNQLNTVKISPTISKQLTNIAAAVNSITPASVQNVTNLSAALQGMNGLQISNWGGLGQNNGGQAQNTTAPTGTTGGAGAAATSNMTQYTQAITAANTATGGFMNTLRNLGGVFSRAFSTLGGAALTGLNGFVNGISVAATAAIRVGKFLGQAIGSKIVSRVKQVTSAFGQLFSSLKRIAMYRAIRFFFSQLTQAMKEGINNLYQYSSLMGGTFKSSMDSLATSFQYLKNSMGAMVSPIINTLAPAIDYLIDKFVSLLNIVNQFFARLTGASTYTVAKKAVTSYADSVSDAADTASSAAKEIKDATTGIDELNIINQDDSSGSGSGGGSSGGTDYSSMFEELPIDSSISDFVDQLKEAFEAGDWEGLGTLLGEKFNSIVDSVDWSDIGHKIGYGLNGAIQTAYYFLDTVNFTNIGTHIAELLNAALSEIDFTYVGSLFVKKFTILPDLVIGFLSELDWGLVGKSISDYLMGAFDEATKWLNSYDWSDLGSLLWQKIKDLVTNIDWGGIATSIFTFLGTAIRSCRESLGGFFGSIGEDIKKWFDEEIAGENWTEIAVNLLTAIGKGFVNIGSWVVEYIIDPFFEALLGEEKWAAFKWVGECLWGWFTEGVQEFFDNPGAWIEEHIIDPIFEALLGEEKWAAFKWVGECLWDWFTEGVQEFFDDPGAWIKEHIVDPFVNWVKNLSGINSPSTVMKEIGQDVVNGFLEGLNFFSSIAETVKKWGSSVVEWFTKGEDGKGIVEHFKEAAGDIISGFKEKVGSTYTTVKTKVTTWAGKVKEWFTNKSFGGVNLSTFATYASEIIEGFKSKIGSAYTNVKTKVTTWASKVKEWFTGDSDGGVNSTTFSTFANDTIEGFKDKIGSAYTNVKSNITTWATNVKN